MKTVTYHIPNISCMHCTHTIETELGDLNGIKAVKADLPTKMVEISYDAPATEEQIKSLLEEIEYPAAA